jgi:hypothetical protein
MRACQPQVPTLTEVNAPGALRRGTGPAGGTCATRGPVEPDADDRVARDIMARPPIDAGMALGTVRLMRSGWSASQVSVRWIL